MKQLIQTQDAPRAIGPYSQAIKAGNTVYLSGQIALDAATMQLVEGDFSAQLKKVFENLFMVSQAAGGSLANVVKLTIYLVDMADYQMVNEVMKDYFAEPYPARATFAVAALPKNASVEVDAIMVLGE